MRPLATWLSSTSDGEPALFLDSSPEPGQTRDEARLRERSVLALSPSEGLAVKGKRLWRRDSRGAWIEASGAAWEAVRSFVKNRGRAFVGAFFGYDAARHLEKLPERAVDDLPLPDALLYRFERALEWRHADGEFPEEATGPTRWRNGSPSPAMSPASFEAIVARAREAVYAGEVYQVNLSHRFTTDAEGDPRALYLALRRANPAPFAAYFESGPLPEGLARFQLLSSSPERLLRVKGRRVEARPIAGTRPRGATRAEDARLVEELSTDEKERAEHVMLVDLARNDLGRVSRFGTVRVDDLLTVESYRRVHHLVSGVSGELAEGKDAFDAFEAVFPGGTITGAPKVRAMEIIDELEPVRRGAYTGSLGFFAENEADLNILIRTLVYTQGRLDLQVGAGIVWDSDPAREHAETLAKARALFEALDGARARTAGPGGVS